MIRHIEENDYYKNYMELINTFTREPQPSSYNQFKKSLQHIYNQGSEIFVIEVNNKIVSSIHLFYEYKLHNNFKSVCHIEDVVTDKEYQQKGYASSLLSYAIQRATTKNCYKVVLCSNSENSTFYVKNGFQTKGVELCKYL